MNEPVIIIPLKMEKLIYAETKEWLDPMIIRCVWVDPPCTNNVQHSQQGNEEIGKIWQVIFYADIKQESDHYDGGWMLQVHLTGIEGMYAGNYESQNH